jgi:hypothetical protein
MLRETSDLRAILSNDALAYILAKRLSSH